jgi:hypothetical protein
MGSGGYARWSDSEIIVEEGAGQYHGGYLIEEQ